MRINFRFVTYLLLSVGLLVAIAFGVHRLQAWRNASLLLTQARAAVEVQQYPRAVSFYGRYMAFNSQDVEAKVEFGDLLKLLGQLPDAYFQLEGALRLRPDQPQVRQSLVEVTIGLERYADAQQQLETHLLPQDPQNPRLLWLLATCQQKQANYPAARDNLQAAVEGEPTNASYAADLAALLTERFSQSEQAKQVLDQLVAATPSEPSGRLARGAWLLGRARHLASVTGRQPLLQAAWDDCMAASKLAQHDAQTALLGTEVAIARNDVSSARELITDALQHHPQIAELYGSAAQIELHEQNLPSAVDWLQRGLKAIPGQPDLLWNLAQLELDQGNVATVTKLIEELRSRNYAEAPLRYLQARVLVADRKWREAAKLLEDSRALFDRSKDLLKQVDYLLATCYQNLGNLDQQLVTLRRAVSADPLWGPGRQALAEALLRNGRMQEAVAEYRQAVSQPNPPLGVIVSWTRLMFVETLSRGGATPDWGPVERGLEMLQAHPAATDDWTVLRAELLLAKGQAQEAEQLLQERLAAEPQAVPIHQALIALHIRNQDFDAADAALTAAEAALPDSPTVRLERARFLVMKQGDKVNRGQLERLAIPLGEWSDVQRAQLAAGIASYFQSIADYPRSVRYAQLAAETEAGQSSLALHLLLFELALRTNNLETMKSALDQVERIEGKGPLWRVGQAVQLSVEAERMDDQQAAQRQANYTAASGHLAEAMVIRPGWSRIPRLQGELLDRQNNTDQAIESYLNAIKLGEQDPQLVSRVVFLLFEKGRFVEADEVVRKLQEQKTPFSSELTRVASQVSLQLENFDRALSLAQGWARESGKPEDHVWLAQVYSITGDPEGAIKEFRTAIEMEPAQAAGWVSLIQMYVRQGDVAAAEATLAEAEQAIDQEQAPDALAQCYQALRDNDQAAKIYQQAVEKNPQDAALLRRYAGFCLETGLIDRAQPLLERLVSSELAANEVDQAWGRRSLALLLGLDGSDKAFDRARELLESNIKLDANSIDDQRTLAVVLSRRPDRPSHDQAINILQGLVRTQPQFSIADHAVLAELYTKTRQWTLYSRTMRSILGNGGADDPRFVRDYAQALVEQGELAEAQIWTSRLESMAPEELSTATIESQLLFRAAEYERLLQMLESKATSTDRQLWGAELSEQYGTRLQQIDLSEVGDKFLQLAEKLYTQVAEGDSPHALALAGFQARHGNMSQCLAKLETMQDIPADELARLGQGALNRGQATATELEALLQIATSELAKQPRHVGLSMLVGDLLSWLGKYSQAVATYRQVLSVEPRHVPALNNLAMVLALSGQDLPQALLSIEQSIALAGNQFYLLDTRGLVHLAMGNYQNAESDFRASIEGKPRPDQWFHLAQAMLALKRLSEAKAAFGQAVEGGISASTVHPLESKIFERMSQQFR